MIESLAEHGVQPEDLVPALMTTHSVKNPEYDPKAAKVAELEREQADRRTGDEEVSDMELEGPPPPYELREGLPDMPLVRTSSERGRNSKTRDATPTRSSSDLPTLPKSRSTNPFGSDDEDDDLSVPSRASGSTPPKPVASSPTRSLISPQPKSRSSNPFGDDDDDEDDLISRIASPSRPTYNEPSTIRPSSSRLPSFDMDEDEGDIGRPASPDPIKPESSEAASTPLSDNADVALELQSVDTDPERTPTRQNSTLPLSPTGEKQTPEEEDTDDQPAPLPSLPGVSTSLTTADENVILDIRWTVVRDHLPHFAAGLQS